MQCTCTCALYMYIATIIIKSLVLYDYHYPHERVHVYCSVLIISFASLHGRKKKIFLMILFLQDSSERDSPPDSDPSPAGEGC